MIFTDNCIEFNALKRLPEKSLATKSVTAIATIKPRSLSSTVWFNFLLIFKSPYFNCLLILCPKSMYSFCELYSLEYVSEQYIAKKNNGSPIETITEFPMVSIKIPLAFSNTNVCPNAQMCFVHFPNRI